MSMSQKQFRLTPSSRAMLARDQQRALDLGYVLAECDALDRRLQQILLEGTEVTKLYERCLTASLTVISDCRLRQRDGVVKRPVAARLATVESFTSWWESRYVVRNPEPG